MKMNYKDFITIDPGKSGGIILERGGRVQAYKMPMGLTELDCFIKENIYDPCTTLCFIEQVQLWGTDGDRGKQFRIQKMLGHFEQLKSVLTLNKIAYCIISPQSWQKSLNLKLKIKEEKSIRKNRYKIAAQGWYPHIKVSLWNSDALLIHRFLRLKLQTDIGYINERIVNKFI